MENKTTDIAPPGEYREVSELRIQYFCEYRYFLTKSLGDPVTDAAKAGRKLHSQVSEKRYSSHELSVTKRILIIILILIFGLIWIFW